MIGLIFRRVCRRLKNVLQPGRLDREFTDELEFHRQMRLQKAHELGHPAEEAEAETKRRMGNVTLAKEEMRDARIAGWLAASLQDLRYGIFLLRRDPGASALIVLVLALGIGGNAAVFSLLKAALLDPLPYPNAGRLVTVLENNGWLPTVAEFLEIRARTRTLEQMAFIERHDMLVTVRGEPTHVCAARVTASFFPLLGVAAMQGRTFLAAENQPWRTPAVVLTDRFWRTHFGADPEVVGRKIELDGGPALVVGVLPSRFHFDYPTLSISESTDLPESVDIYVPYPIQNDDVVLPASIGHAPPVRVLARLRQGVSQTQTNAELRGIGQVLVRDRPDPYGDVDGGPSHFKFETLPLRDAIVGTQRSLLWLLLGGVVVLLLTACANAAQLLFARSLRRGREIAIRAALGASRPRLIRQFLIEGLVLAACAGIAGLLLSKWIAQVLVALLPMRNPLLASAHWDAGVVVFTSTISLISVIVFATVPALKASRPLLALAVSAQAKGEGNRWRHTMSAIEAALSMFLLCGAGLVTQNLWKLISTPTGFNPDHLLAMRLTPPFREQKTVVRNPSLQVALSKISAIPGVDSAATVTEPPVRSPGRGNDELLSVTTPTGRSVSVIGVGHTHRVSPDYFRTMGIPLLTGRVFRSDDDLRHPYVAIVSQEFARQFGVDGHVLRKKFFGEPVDVTIIGVVGDVRTRGLQMPAVPEVYLPSLQILAPKVYLIVRSAIPRARLVKLVTLALQSSNSDQAVFGALTMDDLIADSETEPRFEVLLLGAFALLAVTIAATGMYSVISCLVSQRTHEIAIRVALGASQGSLFRTIIGTTVASVVAGLLCGIGLELLTRNVIRSLSSTTIHGSPWMYLSVALFFLAVTLASASVPVQRARRLDPADALRCD